MIASAPTRRLDDKRVLVTGAGSGIGRRIAVAAGAEGARVAAADIRLDAARDTAGQLGAGSAAVRVDVADGKSVEEAVAEAEKKIGGIDVLVNVAGVAALGAAHETDESDWDRILAVNLKGVYLMSRAVWPRLGRAAGGAIVNIASCDGVRPLPAAAAYCTAKAGVVMLTKCLALDGGEAGIRANCVCPGNIDTPMLAGYLESHKDPAVARAVLVEQTPLARIGAPDDVAAAVVYLASDDAGFVTGADLYVDGGYLI